ncbi:MAG: hypothetical protein FWG35_05675 [Spirochaetaceae bacterium]|nr:hypothetical protein [Spirochaetaceae bacterium]
MAALFVPFTAMICRIIPGPEADLSLIPARLALFHSMFNIVNTLFFLPFVGPFARLVTFIVKPRKDEQSSRYRFVYTGTGPRQAPEINILNAEREIKKMAELKERMFSMAAEAVLASPKKAQEMAQEIDTQEELLRIMHEEISQFLVHCSRENISPRALERLNLLVRICNEMVSIGDCCKKLTACALHKAGKEIAFDRQGEEEIETYAQVVKKFLAFNKERLGVTMAAGEMMEAEALEDSIDKTRDILRKAAQKRLKTKGSIKTEILFIDMLRHIEHVGDHSFEISRALYRMNSGKTPPSLAPPAPG